jgi:hypothetical protein
MIDSVVARSAAHHAAPWTTLASDVVSLGTPHLGAPLAQADCLLIRDPYAPAAPAGSRCRILRLAI